MRVTRRLDKNSRYEHAWLLLTRRWMWVYTNLYSHTVFILYSKVITKLIIMKIFICSIGRRSYCWQILCNFPHSRLLKKIQKEERLWRHGYRHAWWDYATTSWTANSAWSRPRAQARHIRRAQWHWLRNAFCNRCLQIRYESSWSWSSAYTGSEEDPPHSYPANAPPGFQATHKHITRVQLPHLYIDPAPAPHLRFQMRCMKLPTSLSNMYHPKLINPHGGDLKNGKNNIKGWTMTKVTQLQLSFKKRKILTNFLWSNVNIFPPNFKGFVKCKRKVL